MKAKNFKRKRGRIMVYNMHDSRGTTDVVGAIAITGIHGDYGGDKSRKQNM